MTDYNFDHFSEEQNQELSELILEGSNEFEFDGFRFIHIDHIDKIQQEELASDLYVLGCFNASFLAGILDIDQEVIEAIQQAEAYEAVGKLIISLGKLEEVQTDYASADGYGHHFNHYDGNEYEVGPYLVFQV